MFMGRKAQTQLPTIIENLGDLNDLSMSSGQSTPAHGSFHNLPIPPATPTISSKSTLHAQHTLARVCETLVMTTTGKKQGPTTPRRCRPTHGLVTIKTHPEQQTGFKASLCIEIDLISVVSGAGLDDTILSMPVQYAELKVVPDHDNVFCLKVKTPVAHANGIFVVVSDCSARDRWLEAFSAFTNEAEFDRLCSNDEPDGRPLKREPQTQQRAYRNQPRPWAPSRIRFTSEAEFDRLCSNDEPEGLL
jgi:hypothetical protein